VPKAQRVSLEKTEQKAKMEHKAQQGPRVEMVRMAQLVIAELKVNTVIQVLKD